MNPDFTALQQQVALLQNRVDELMLPNRYRFIRDIDLFNGKNIRVGRSIGTKIGFNALDKLSVYGVTPIVQAGAISSPTGGATIDGQARAAIDSIRVALTNFGITA